MKSEGAWLQRLYFVVYRSLLAANNVNIERFLTDQLVDDFREGYKQMLQKLDQENFPQGAKIGRLVSTSMAA